MVEESLDQHPGVWHGCAEGHTWLSDKERLEMALKACDLYLARLERLEELLTQARTEHHRR